MQTMDSEEHKLQQQSQEKLCIQGSRRFRIMQNILCNPPACLFLMSLLILTICCPLLVLYMNIQKELPDFDKMKTWNSFLGKLPHYEFCLNTSDTNEYSLVAAGSQSVSVQLSFMIHSDTFHNKSLRYLTLHVTGKELETRIRNIHHTRVDVNVTLKFQLDISQSNHCNSTWCTVTSCVLITVPPNTPHFNVFSSTPCEDCLCRSTPQFHENGNFNMKLSDGSCHVIAKPVHERYRGHGLIVLYLSHEDKRKAETNLFKTSISFAVLLILFLVCMACTGDRLSQLLHID